MAGLERALPAAHYLSAEAFQRERVMYREWFCAGRAEAAPLADQLGPVPQRLGRYPLEELRVGRRLAYRVAANWKLVAENYDECYHCAGVHPELCRVVPAFKRGGAGLDWERGILHGGTAET